jgi:hypothetical protein
MQKYPTTKGFGALGAIFGQLGSDIGFAASTSPLARARDLSENCCFLKRINPTGTGAM